MFSYRYHSYDHRCFARWFYDIPLFVRHVLTIATRHICFHAGYIMKLDQSIWNLYTKWNIIKVMTWIHKRMGIKTVLSTKMYTDTKCAQRRLLWFPIWRMLDQLNETIKGFGIAGPTHMEPFLIGDWARFQPVREGVTYVRYHWAKCQPMREGVTYVISSGIGWVLAQL